MNDEYGNSQMPTGYQDPQPNGGGGQGLAIASMVLGIVSIVLSCVWYISLVCAIAGLVCGISNNRKNGRNGMATAGIVCSIIGIVLTIALIVLAAVSLAMFGGLATLQEYGM